MSKYRAIVSIEFDDDDLQELADALGVDLDRISPDEAVIGELDGLALGSAWLEQLFSNGQPTIARLSGGIQVEVNPHDEIN